MSTFVSPFVPHDLASPLKGAATGPLAGLTVAVKDMYDIAGERTGGGNPDWLAAEKPAVKTAPIVQRLLDAGATIIGKTVCDEFFFSVTGVNAHYGTPLNVRAPGRVPGGSSSGSAAAVAAGACDAALGSDTGGSVRIPAALCGLYGIRPTHGRVDLSGAMAMAESFDVAGWFTAGPGLLRKIGGVLLDGPAERRPVARLLMPADAFSQADQPVATALRQFLKRAAGVLPQPEETTIAPQGFDDWRSCFRTIQGREVWGVYGPWLERHRPRLGPGIRERLAYAATVSAADADAARAVMAAARERLRALIAPGTALCLPTAPCIAPRADVSGEEFDAYRARIMALTCISGLGGLPQVTVPAALVDGCPVGFSLVGSVGADEMLLDLAITLGRFCAA